MTKLQKTWRFELGRVVPFSDVDQYFKGLNLSNGCIADTNFLIAVSDKENSFYEDAQFLWEKLSEYQVPLYVSVTAKAEFVDFHRRVIITETLMDMLAPSSKWKISSAIRELLRSQKGWIDNQDDPYLTDARIKACKQAFTPEKHSGHIGWLELCKEYLVGRLLTAWDKISDDLSLNYIDMRAEDTKDLFRKNLEWPGMYRLAEQTAVGSGDAMR